MAEMNLHQKLIEVRKAVPYLQKENEGYQFKFVSSSQTLGAVRGVMDDVGVLLVPRVTGIEVRDHATSKGGHEYFTCLVMEFTWVNAENPEDTIVCPWYGQGLDSGEKGVGKAMTYAEKFFILKFFNIATDQDDPDAFQEKKPPQKRGQKKVGGTTGKTDQMLRDEIREMILKYSAGDGDLAKETLRLITAFKGQDGEMVEGVYSTQGMAKWSRKRIEIAHRETMEYCLKK